MYQIRLEFFVLAILMRPRREWKTDRILTATTAALWRQFTRNARHLSRKPESSLDVILSSGFHLRTKEITCENVTAGWSEKRLCEIGARARARQ